MLKYQIALINVWWSEDSIDTRFFNSVNEQKSYFNNLTSGLFSPLVNFLMNNNIETTVAYRDSSGRSASELVKCNYAVIQELNESNTVINQRYFFAYPLQDSGTQMIVRLSLDDIQTNYFLYKQQISPCVINRACLNRFIKNGNLFNFNLSSDSPLYFREPYNLPKIPTQLTKLSWEFTGNQEVDEWLNNNVAYWCYVFIDGTHTYKFFDINGGDLNITTPLISSTQSNNGQIITNPYGVMCYPIYKGTGKIICRSNNKDFSISFSSYEGFKLQNEDTSFVYNVKGSIISPLNNNINTMFVEGNNLIIEPSYQPEAQDNFSFTNINGFITSYNTSNFIFGGLNQPAKSLQSNQINIPYSFSFSQSQITGNTNINLNPKLLNQDCISLDLIGFDGNKFSYDIQKINNNTISFLYNETIQPEITKYYCRLNAPTGLYLQPTNLDFLGVVGSTDTTIALANDQYQNYIANNKNFWLQSSLNLASEFVDFSSIGKTISLENLKDTAVKATNLYLSLDNLKQAPDTLKNAGGNFLYSSQIKELGIYIEIQTAINSELSSANDYNLLYGFSYGKIGNVGDFDNIRIYYNYLECVVENISAPISNLEKEKLRNRLSSIRFWNSDNIQYSLENYERSILENGNI